MLVRAPRLAKVHSNAAPVARPTGGYHAVEAATRRGRDGDGRSGGGARATETAIAVSDGHECAACGESELNISALQ
ncbi:unnamed protein product [Phyllotreta striolata]|uniref:Uncharacterized protein n=1 Tax=Phyllotreta striolata TaxID=444603 RepID=A0A9N9TJR4_PHYSR|nr:unnamed protein product [Phyllotreta striolata]